MKIAGIIAEYNPFHNGHAHQAAYTRAREHGCEATHLVAVMSGNFTQRGEPALLRKRRRAAMALAGGLDLILELPLPWSMSSAETFAAGGVALLDALGCVDTLSFGSECGKLLPLQKAAALMETERFTGLLRYHLSGGLSYPAAKEAALRECGGASADLLRQPNNTLGIAYLQAMARQGVKMDAFTVPRLGSEHGSPVPIGTIASAAYLRSLVNDGRVLNAAPYLPPESFRLLREALAVEEAPARPALAERAVLYRLRSMSREELADLPDISEGLENRLFAAGRQAASLEEFYALSQTRRYPRTRIQRLLWSAFLGRTGSVSDKTPPYLRVLAANERGREILAAAKEAGVYRRRGIPVITRAADVKDLSGFAAEVWQQECRADDLYGLLLPKPLPCGTTMTDGLVCEE